MINEFFYDSIIFAYYENVISTLVEYDFFQKSSMWHEVHIR